MYLTLCKMCIKIMLEEMVQENNGDMTQNTKKPDKSVWIKQNKFITLELRVIWAYLIRQN